MDEEGKAEDGSERERICLGLALTLNASRDRDRAKNLCRVIICFR